MALIPKNRYPGQIDISDPSGYPQGKAQDISSPGDGTGTPWQEDLVNDFFGLEQALLAQAAITPSGNPDKVGASQYLLAIQKVADQRAADFAAAYGGLIRESLTDTILALSVGVSVKITGFDATLPADGVRVVVSHANDNITVNAAAVYEIHALLSFRADIDTTINLFLFKNGAVLSPSIRATVKTDPTEVGNENQIGLSALVTLAAADVLDLRVQAGATVDFILQEGSTFWVRRVA